MRKLTLLVAVTLLGCAVGPDYQRPVVVDLIEIALAKNNDTRIAAARVEEFAARVDRSSRSTRWTTRPST